ncbi:Cholecystokinin receptor [Trichinella papuae]|uniref:Cholecystokinin receptor n=1 Tax=Trichinella papuae TaxID=268474 RepID=A0A0V1M9X5_9BILA|nr:Cholecystokinin receptor [Trichinella papuae]
MSNLFNKVSFIEHKKIEVLIILYISLIATMQITHESKVGLLLYSLISNFNINIKSSVSNSFLWASDLYREFRLLTTAVVVCKYGQRDHSRGATFTCTVRTVNISPYEELPEPCQLIDSSGNKLLMVVFTIIFCLSVIGNSLVIVTIVQNRWMRTITNLFLLNMAISDLLLTLICMPPTLTAILFQCFIWGQKMRWMCTLISFLQPVSVAANANTLVAIALERYYALCRPLHSRQWQTKSNVVRMMIIVWTASFTCSIPQAIVAEVIEIRPGQLNCRDNWPSGQAQLIYFIFLSLVLFIIPLIIMTMLYSLVIRSLWLGIKLHSQQSEPSLLNSKSGTRQSSLDTTDQLIDEPDEKRTSKNGWATFKLTTCSGFFFHNRPKTEPTAGVGSNGSNGANGESAIQSNRSRARLSGAFLRSTHIEKSLQTKKRVIKMLAAIVVEFFICWMPFYTFYLVVIIRPALFDASCYVTFLIMAYLSTCTNPITYCFMNSKFRKAFLAAIGCHIKEDEKANFRKSTGPKRREAFRLPSVKPGDPLPSMQTLDEENLIRRLSSNENYATAKQSLTDAFMEIVEKPKSLTEDEAKVYDRQMRLWGVNGQMKIRGFSVILCGVHDIGAEMAKNLILSGIKQLTLVDDTVVNDERTSLLIKKNSIGMLRSEASREVCQQFNPSVEVKVESIQSLNETLLEGYDLLVDANGNFKFSLHLHHMCSVSKVSYLCCTSMGVYSFYSMNCFSSDEDKNFEVPTKALHLDDNGKNADVDRDIINLVNNKQFRSVKKCFVIICAKLLFEMKHDRMLDFKRHPEDTDEFLAMCDKVKARVMDKSDVKIAKEDLINLTVRLPALSSVLAGTASSTVIDAALENPFPSKIVQLFRDFCAHFIVSKECKFLQKFCHLIAIPSELFNHAVSVTTIQLIDSHGNIHTLSFNAPDEDSIPFYNYYDANEAENNEEIIHIFHFYIQCKALQMNFSEAKEFKLHSRIHSVLSLNVCMHHCLSTGSNWVFRAVVYYEEKKICELYTKNINGNSILSTEEQKMIKLYNCFKDRESERINNPEPLNIFFEELSKLYVILIIGLCFTTSEQTSFVAHFPDENLSCLLELHHLRQNETSLLEKLPVSTLTDCIVACYMQNQSGFCNTVYFSKSQLMCYFIKQQEDTFESTDEEFRYLYYFIHKCTFGKKNLLDNEKIKKKSCNFDTLKSHVILHDVSLICYLEQRSLKEAKNAIPFRNLTSSSLFTCIFFCQQWYAFVHCNAVSFSLETGNCILYHDYVPTLQRTSVECSSTKFYSVILCMDSSSMSEWMEYVVNFGSRSTFLTANLYEFFEICKIKEVDPKGIKNLTLHESYSRVNSLNTCLHKCRRAISEWPYRAVHYSSEKKYCYIYVKSSGTSVNVTLEADEQFVELQTCFTDRRSDRANNPDALAFYIKSQGEVCLVEFYEKNFLNHWRTINYIMNVTNITECLSWCRHYDNSDKCSAINFAIDGKCRLLKKSHRRLSYRTLPKSVFGEILVCKPGCLTDEFQPYFQLKK